MIGSTPANPYLQRALAVCEAIEEAVWTALESGLTPDEVRAEVEAAIRTAEDA